MYYIRRSTYDTKLKPVDLRSFGVRKRQKYTAWKGEYTTQIIIAWCNDKKKSVLFVCSYFFNQKYILLFDTILLFTITYD